ncbi:MAG: hypothetical protein G01um101430_227 [Parcubacteria group bacterium Gr01-1014_30]|nr:MAG: hypothetical protein G01um101430_227 [Parcubacteria group bacterium Gr01-1014_30]
MKTEGQRKAILNLKNLLEMDRAQIGKYKKLGEIYRYIFGLNIPFVQQTHENSCGAAALEMVYRYSRVKSTDQMDIFNKYKKQNPISLTDFYIETNDLITDARQTGFNNARWERMDISNKNSTMDTLARFIRKGVPIIACQQFTKERPDIGHFRVITKVRSGHVYFHDPNPKYGGKNLRWSVEKFIDYWRSTGNNVTGGVLLIIEK